MIYRVRITDSLLARNMEWIFNDLERAKAMIEKLVCLGFKVEMIHD